MLSESKNEILTAAGTGFELCLMGVKLSIVIPAHNEEYRLPPMLKSYARFFSARMGDDFEILVVVNGSRDCTVDVACEIAKGFSQIKVIDEPRQIGKGGAIILGVKQARGEWIGFVDADGATSAEEFERLYRCGLSLDGVIGSRWKRGAQVNIKQTGMRLLSSRLFNGLTRLLLGLIYKDTQCGAKIFKIEAWRTILPHIGTTRFAFDVDVLFQLKRNGFSILEEATVWSDVAGSKVKIMNTSFEMFCAVIRMRLLYSPFRVVVKWYDLFLAKPVEFLLRDELFRHASLLFSASIIAAFGNIGFQMIVGRVLPKSEFALLATFLALFIMASRPLSTLQTAMTHYTSLLVQENHGGVVKRLLKKWVSLTGVVSVVLSAVCIVFARQIAGFFHLERVSPVVVSALALPVIFVEPVLSGALQGLQRFTWSSAAGISNALGRVLFGGLFVLLLYPACGWALAGHVGGMYVSLLVGVTGLLLWAFKQKRDDSELPSFRFYLSQCFFIQICAGFLLTGDVVLVKHYLPNDFDFAFAATVGRMVAFMAASVAMAMFPKVASAGTFSAEHRSLYLRAQLYTWVFVGGSLVICLFFPAVFHRVIFGITEPSRDLIWLTRWMGLAMAAAASLNLNVSLLLAQRRFKLLSSVVICAAFYFVTACLFHTSSYVIAGFAGVANLVALIVTTIGILKTKDVCLEESN
jgi:glycosyltransferase involved in cell wall biosynthesis